MDDIRKKQTLRQRLIDWRSAEGYRSAKAAASDLGVSMSAFYNWEGGHVLPDPVNLAKLKAAGVQVDDLITAPEGEPTLAELNERLDQMQKTLDVLAGKLGSANGLPDAEELRAKVEAGVAKARQEILAELELPESPPRAVEGD